LSSGSSPKFVQKRIVNCTNNGCIIALAASFSRDGHSVGYVIGFVSLVGHATRLQRNRHCCMGNAVEKIDSAVDRIDYPTEFRIQPTADALFAYDRDRRKCPSQLARDNVLALDIEREFNVVVRDFVCLFGAIEVVPHAAARGARRFHSRFQCCCDFLLCHLAGFVHLRRLESRLHFQSSVYTRSQQKCYFHAEQRVSLVPTFVGACSKKRGGCSFQLSNAAQKFADWEAVFIDVSQAVEPNIDALTRVFTTELG